MANTLAKSVLVMVVLGLVYRSSAAPVQDIEENTVPVVEQNGNSETDQDIISDTDTEKLSTTGETPSSEENDGDVNKEVTNYHSIEIDGNSKLEEPDAIEGNGGVVLSDKDAEELLLELSSPSDVAQFIVASDDARGFLEALRLLTDQGYITLKMAYYIRDRVMDELRRMLMIQEIELSRTLLNNYDDFTQEQLPNSEPPAPYYDDEFNTYVTEDQLYPQVPYELYEDSLRQENSRALAEIAEAVAQRIATGELTSENGVKIMNTVASLLPDSYWQDALDIFSDGFPNGDSDYSQDSIGSAIIQLSDDEAEEEEDEGDDEDSTEVEDESEKEGADLETELRNRNMKNVLEKQLVHKAHIKEENTPSEEEGITNFDNTVVNNPDLVEIDEPELTEEDYQAFFDWLENAMVDMPGQEGADQEALLVKDDDDDDKSSSEERPAETNHS